MKLEKYSFGIGDRFAHQGKAQLDAFFKAKEAGIPVVPVWNKSFREHQTVGSSFDQPKQEADEAVKSLGWTDNYYVDADHINLSNVDGFLEHANFFTIDVADYIGKKAGEKEMAKFTAINTRLIQNKTIPGIPSSASITEETIRGIGEKYLFAVRKAGEIYRYIADQKGADQFIPEISMDETDQPQTPLELLLILNALAVEKIPVQNLAPKFTGRFNKGVDYQGDKKKFEKDFEADVQVVQFAIDQFGLPDNLKLSIHTGSDKFSIYPVIGKIIQKHGQGIHVKTAGTTWLAEAIGLCLGGQDGLDLIKSIYHEAYDQVDDLTAAYAHVIDIEKAQLPVPDEVNHWEAEDLVRALRHVPDDPAYNHNLRQLLHVSYKIAAQRGTGFTDLLKKYHEPIAREVTENLFDRHMKKLFLP
jgi:hypothetical protein